MNEPDPETGFIIVLRIAFYDLRHPVWTFVTWLPPKKLVQAQWIGNAEGPVKPKDRKYHLLMVKVSGDSLEMRSINPDVLGKDLGDTARLKAAFAAHKDDPKLFAEPENFRRIE